MDHSRIEEKDKIRKDINVRYRDHVNEIILSRLKVALAIGTALNFCFLPVYWKVYPESFFKWIPIFSVETAAFSLSLACIIVFKKIKPFIVWFADIMGLLNIIALCLIVFMTDGSSSRYYQGVSQTFMFYPFVNPFYIGHFIFFSLVSVILYNFSMLCFHGKFDMTNFLFANYFMITNAIIIIFLSKFYGEKHYNDFVSQEQLKKNEETLQSQAKELARSNKDLEQLAYVASHDLQEPLRMVATFCQKLQKDYKDKLDQDANEYIFYAVDGAKRMQALISALLKYAQVGKKDVEITEVDLNRVIGTILNDISLVIKEKDATIKVGHLPVILANEIQMYQLFQNFLTNALKFKGTRAPVVEISARKQNNGWEFTVSDNGIGIDEQHFSKLFVIFQRFHERGAYPGSGIGLALCKKIVENFNGKIWVKSKVGEGTSFYFTLNVREAGV